MTTTLANALPFPATDSDDFRFALSVSWDDATGLELITIHVVQHDGSHYVADTAVCRTGHICDGIDDAFSNIFENSENYDTVYLLHGDRWEEVSMDSAAGRLYTIARS